MRNKLFFTGLVSALLIFAIFAGCDNGTTTKDVVVVTAPGPVITMEGPKETVEVPGQNAGDLRKALQAAQDKLIADPSATPPVVVITGQIPIQANSSITVPDYVTLQIRKGARLTVEANALFFVKEHAVVDVQGELYFEQFANGDDVRQAKIVGKVIANGGTIYDKSDQGLLLQYVSSIKDGGRLAFGGGQQVAGGAVTRERYLLGTANFKGEIKLKFSDGWTVYNPIIINPDAAATGNENILVWPEVALNDRSKPGLKGFEVVSDLEITEGDMIIPDKSLIEYVGATAGDARTNDFIIKTGVTVTIAKGASLITQNAVNTNVSGLILEEQAKLVVNGKLGLPSRLAANHPTSTNLGTITVNAGGTILDDGAAFGNAFDQSLATSGPTQKKGTIILMPGSIAMYNRAAPTIYASQGGTGDIKSGAATKIEMTDLLYKITGGVAEVNSQFTLPTGVNVELEGADVTFNAAFKFSSDNESFTLNKGSKAVFKLKFTSSTPAWGKIVANDKSTVAFDGTTSTGAMNDYPAVVTLNGGSTGVFEYVAAVTLMPPKAGVTTNASTIHYKKGPGAAGTTTSTIADGSLPAVAPYLQNGNGLIFDIPVTVTQGGLPFNRGTGTFNEGLTVTVGDLSLTSSTLTTKGLITMTSGDFLLSDSTATIEDITIVADTKKIELGSNSHVELSGTAAFDDNGAGTPAYELNIVDARSTFVGKELGVSKIRFAPATTAMECNAASLIGLPGLVTTANTMVDMVSGTGLVATWKVITPGDPNLSPPTQDVIGWSQP